MERNTEEAPQPGDAQSGRMTYNNFSCRLAVPRASVSVPLPLPEKTSATKPRKAARRRLLSAAATLLLMGSVAISTADAEDIDLTSVKLRVTPAKGTVAFTGVTGRISLEVPVQEPASNFDLPTQFGALAAEVNDLAAFSLGPMPPSPQGHLSLLTGVFLCAGLGVALAAVGRIHRSDQAY
jgi:hypothetical protein